MPTVEVPFSSDDFKVSKLFYTVIILLLPLSNMHWMKLQLKVVTHLANKLATV